MIGWWWLRGATEPEKQTGLVAEVALVVVALGERVAKAGQQVVKLGWPKGDVFAQWNVDATADDEIKRIVAWGGAQRCASTDAGLV